jgi:ribonuclease Z
VDGFNTAYAQDAAYRTAHHGEGVLPAAAAHAVAREIPLADTANASARVLERDGLTVTMFRVDHAPVAPAVGYRFDYRGRSVVVSGDTKRSQSLVEHAKGADILIHEALQPALIARAVAGAQRLEMPRLAKLAGDIPGYHASPVEAAEVAQAAGVRHLVLTHLVPAPNNFLTRRLFLAGVSAAFGGEVTLGTDGMRFDLPAGG